jgi:hypothetical protein
VSAGPGRTQARPHVVAGGFGTSAVTMALSAPRGERIEAIHAAAHVQSGNPPRPGVTYAIECSTDGGVNWTPIVKDWTIVQRGEQPDDFWSQSLCWGSAPVAGAGAGAGAGAKAVRVRFRNEGGRPYSRAEAHLVYRAAGPDPTEVSFDWVDDSGPHRTSHVFDGKTPPAWDIATGHAVRTHWVELRPRPLATD